MPTFECKFDGAAAAAALDALAEDVVRAARPAAFAAAQVLYERVKQNVSRLGRKTGNLEQSIYHAFADTISTPESPKYRISWNYAKAPHGHLVEFGHIQYFKTYLGKDGRWHTRVRPEALGMKVVRDKSGTLRTIKDQNGRRMRKPKRGASLAEKSRYFDPLPSPKQVPARPFVRTAVDAFPRALEAAESRFFERLAELRDES